MTMSPKRPKRMTVGRRGAAIKGFPGCASLASHPVVHMRKSGRKPRRQRRKVNGNVSRTDTAGHYGWDDPGAGPDLVGEVAPEHDRQVADQEDQGGTDINEQEFHKSPSLQGLR